MPSSLGSHLPIIEGDLAKQRVSASGLISKVDWTPRVQLAKMGSAASEFQAGARVWRPSITTTPNREELSLIKVARSLSQDPNLMSENANYVLLAIREALCLGLHLGQQYFKASGVLELQTLNSTGRLAEAQKAEFSAKQNTSSAITVFSAAAFLAWRLGSYKEDKVAAVSVDFHGLPELDLSNPMLAVKCFLFYLTAYLDPDKTGLVKNDLTMVKMALHYSNAVLAEMKMRAAALKYAEPFTEVSYQLDGTDFVVAGFDVLRHTVATSAEFKHLEFGEIVGNREAKHQARRWASRLACYDLKTKKNPFVELGGTQSVGMGFGKPGTGKTMLISATATEIERLCRLVGIPFLYWPLPDNVVSTFQGGSAERMADWMKRFGDDDKVIYGPIDDGENNLEDRTRQGVSAGVREVIGVFLRGTEGASALQRGNTLLPIYTNLPEQLDKAVLSRVQVRSPINGAVTEHDFLDQDHLWWRRLKQIDPGFIEMIDPRDYEYMSDQALLHSLVESGQTVTELSDERLREVLAAVRERYEVKEHAFYGALFVAVAKVYPNFSSRDVRNIQQAVQSRIIDFDLPEDWLENPEKFYHQAYDVKLEMLKSLMRENMKRLSFADIRHEETLRYLNAMATIASADRERRIEQTIESVQIQVAAERRLRQTT